LIEIDPDPEKPDYVVVDKVQGVDGPNQCIKHNIHDNCLFFNNVNSITVKKVNEVKGVNNTGIVIRTRTVSNDPNIGVEIEAYEAVGHNGIITGNNFGVLEGFIFDVNKGQHKKVFETNLNQNLPSNLHQQITAMSVCDNQRFVAVATTVKNGNYESCLSKLYVFSISNKGLTQIAVKEFYNTNPNSLYFYLNFEYDFKGTSMIFAFQDDDEYRLDVYAFENKQNLKLVHSKKNYHTGDFSAIRALGGKIVSVDYEGEMRVLSIPEN